MADGNGNSTVQSNLCTTVSCKDETIIVDACKKGGIIGTYDFDITSPDGTTTTVNDSLPFLSLIHI